MKNKCNICNFEYDHSNGFFWMPRWEHMPKKIYKMLGYKLRNQNCRMCAHYIKLGVKYISQHSLKSLKDNASWPHIDWFEANPKILEWAICWWLINWLQREIKLTKRVRLI